MTRQVSMLKPSVLMSLPVEEVEEEQEEDQLEGEQLSKSHKASLLPTYAWRRSCWEWSAAPRPRCASPENTKRAADLMVDHATLIRNLNDEGQDKDLRLRPVCRRGLGSLRLLHCLKPSPEHNAVRLSDTCSTAMLSWPIRDLREKCVYLRPAGRR